MNKFEQLHRLLVKLANILINFSEHTNFERTHRLILANISINFSEHID